MSTSPSALLTDLYQLTMAQAYLALGMREPAVFELFVRRLPRTRRFLLAAGIPELRFAGIPPFRRSTPALLAATTRKSERGGAARARNAVGSDRASTRMPELPSVTSKGSLDRNFPAPARSPGGGGAIHAAVAPNASSPPPASERTVARTEIDQ